MKTIFYSLVAVILFSAATCRKSQSNVSLESQLIGAWKYIGKSGGYAGKSEKADPARNDVLEFENGLRYLKKTNDQVSRQGSYELYKLKSIYSGKQDNAIRFDSSSNVTSKNNIISITNDTLTIADNVYDGFQMEYTRIK